MPSNIFSEDLSVNSAAYIDVMNSVAKPWRDGARNGRPYVFHQDFAPSHKFRLTQKQMTKHFHDHTTPIIWLLYSLNLNLSDYYVWSVVERTVTKHPITLYANPSLQLLVFSRH